MIRRTAGLGALSVLAVFFVGVPAALVVVAGWPFPSPDSLRIAVQLRHFPAHLVGHLGATLAWVAWAWLLAATVRMAVDAWQDRPGGTVLGAEWLRPWVIRAVSGALLLSGMAGRPAAWAANAASPSPRPAATRPIAPRPEARQPADGHRGEPFTNRRTPARPAAPNRPTAPVSPLTRRN
jgi:hypothetical protein